ncbi:hypothetical protein A2783_05700 [Microgenomates group bacterium RIFCSPHIGHO2_01_FULL_45_11]|nr:MAG: hypothetical protein A2783_05700 [Microgenomates group bacterium RIFCSPHIGHO2_01_FULL_45_11]
MKKIGGLLIGLILILHPILVSPALAAPPTAACEWTAGGGEITFCVGGFESESQLNNHELIIKCVENCGYDWTEDIQSRWFGGNQVPLRNFDRTQDETGNWYTCVSPQGGFDPSVTTAIASCVTPSVVDRLPVCVGAITVVGGSIGAAIITGSITLPLTIGLLAGAPAACGVAMGALDMHRFTQDLLQGPARRCLPKFETIIQSDGLGIDWCRADLSYSFVINNYEGAHDDARLLEAPTFNLCEQITDTTSKKKCEDCLPDGIWTGLGCLKFNPQKFVENFLTLAVAVAGGIAFLMMLYGAATITSSAGNPESVKKGKEILGGAVAGLLFIIFSVILLNLIGVQILQIPGL